LEEFSRQNSSIADFRLRIADFKIIKNIEKAHIGILGIKEFKD